MDSGPGALTVSMEVRSNLAGNRVRHLAFPKALAGVLACQGRTGHAMIMGASSILVLELPPSTDLVAATRPTLA